MVYIGDGLTDVPCMKLCKSMGGHSIAVYDQDKTVAEGMLKNDRVDYITRADYREGQELEKVIQRMIREIV